MRKRVKEGKNCIINFATTAEQKKQITSKAADIGISNSALLRIIVRQYFEGDKA